MAASTRCIQPTAARRSRPRCWPCHPGWPPACCPDCAAPDEFQAILNIHFRVDADPGPAGFIGLIGGTAEWVFVKRGHVSVTISAANRMVDQGAEAIAAAVWPDVQAALGLRGPHAAMARGEGAARHLRRHRGAGDGCGPGTRTDLREPGAGRRLDRDRVAGHDRRCHQVRPNRGGGVCSPPEHEAMPRETPPPRNRVSTTALHDAVARAGAALARRQHDDGHWLFELEADATIPAEYVLLEHFLDRIDPELEAKIGVYLRGDPGRARRLAAVPRRRVQSVGQREGVFRAEGDRRRSRCAAYAPARDRRSWRPAVPNERNVFTRAQLALFGQVPWRAVPVMPLEIMHLPLWFPFHLSKVSYWSRTVIVPLLVLMALRPKARNPRGIAIPELFRTPPEQVRDWIRGPYRSAWGRFFKGVDVGAARGCSRAFPQRSRRSAIDKAVRVRHRAAERRRRARRHLSGHRQQRDDVRHAGLSARSSGCRHRLARGAQAAGDRAGSRLLPALPVAGLGYRAGRPCRWPRPGVDTDTACAWLLPRQILDVVGDWAVRRPGLRPGGWAFQYDNPHYPDVDDTAVVGMLLHRNGDPAYAAAIERAREWIIGMQSSDGGWGAFEPENTHLYLNHIPFADHGALARPADRGRHARAACRSSHRSACASDDPVMARALAYLRREQEADGSWFGRWGTNYIYGTWSVLCALQRRRHRPRRSGGAAGGGVAALGAARGRRLGRGRGKLRRRAARPLQGEHAEPDRLGGAWPDGGRRRRIIRRRRAAIAYLAGDPARERRMD